MTISDLDLRLLRFRSRRDEYPHALASALIDAGRPKEALEVIHLGLLDDESDGALRTLEGRAFYEQGELHEAQAALLRAAKANPQDKEPFRWLAQVLVERGDPIRALQVLERALAIDPNDQLLVRAHARAERLASSAPGAAVAPKPVSAAPPTPVEKAKPLHNLFGAEARGRAQPSAARAAPAAPAAKTPRQLVPGPLPFDDELERDDESPTTALELTDEMREILRRSLPPEPMFPASSPDEDEDGSEMTSIVPAADELELLRREHQLSRGDHSESDQDEQTLIGSSAALAQPGEAEPPEEVLAVLKAQGVFETAGRTPATSWASGNEVPRSGMQLTRALAVAWVLAIGAVAGGYFAFQRWLETRKSDAASLVASARHETFDGQRASLLSAEKQLAQARALDPKSVPALETLLLAQAARVLEEGTREGGMLRETLGRAQQVGLKSPLVAAAEVLMLPADQREPRLDELIDRVEHQAPRDAAAAYVTGRLAQRAAKPDAARVLLLRATALEPSFGLAWVALGEQARAEGRLDDARQAFTRALGSDGRELRAELWLAVLAARANQGAALLSAVEALAPRIEQAAESDQLFAWTARAYGHLSSGEAAKAKEALRKASALRVEDPELLAFLSEQAQRAGEHTLAYRAARAASDAGGGAPRYQSLVAATLLQQGDGNAALSALSSLGEGHGTLALARAGAALLTNAREPLEHAKKELASYRATAAGQEDVEASSLLMRVDLRLGANVESLMPAARALVQRAPDAAAAHLALGEALVAAEQGRAAVETLQRALQLEPGLADAHFLLGRALRLMSRHNEARQSFERAVAIAPNHVEARRALGHVLVESGDYDAALALFRELAGAGVPSAGLGIAEALLGQGHLSEAAAQIDALPASLKADPACELLQARLLLAKGQPLTAIETLSSVVAEDADTRTADALTLYGDALYASERIEPAGAAYDAALVLDAGQPDALIGRALVAARSGKADAALLLVARAEAALSVRARPPRSRATLALAAAQAELTKQQLDSARIRLAAAVALPGVPAEAYFWYGEALARTRAAGAQAQYAKYLELAPNGPYALRAKRALTLR
jgi:tetratricopeptide (TPR) repeat protein